MAKGIHTELTFETSMDSKVITGKMNIRDEVLN